MLISVNKISNIVSEITITIPSAEVKAEELKRLEEVAPKVKIKGFRQGKVPFDVVQKYFSRTVLEEVIGKLVRESYAKAMQQENLHPVGIPTIKVNSDMTNSNVDLQYVATIEMLPEFELQGLNEVTVEKPVATLTDADVDAEIDKLKKHYTTWNPVVDNTYAAKNGDKLTIDLHIKSLSDNLEKAEEGVEFELGSGMMWIEFEQPLLGAKIGDDFAYNLTFPMTHVEPGFAGKEVAVKVKVLKIQAAQLPALDEVIKKTGFEEKGGFDALKHHIKEAMTRELKYALSSKFDHNVINKLLELTPIEVPKSLIELEANRRVEDLAQRLQKVSGVKKSPMLRKELFTAEATRTVTAGIILAKVIKDNNIVIDEAKLQAKIEELAVEADSARKDEIVNMYQQNKNLMDNIHNLLIEEEALKVIKEQMLVVEKEITVAEALRKQ